MFVYIWLNFQKFDSLRYAMYFYLCDRVGTWLMHIIKCDVNYRP